jgi:hypothetical protein
MDRVRIRSLRSDGLWRFPPLHRTTDGRYLALVEGSDGGLNAFRMSWGGWMCGRCDREYQHEGPHGVLVPATDEEIWATVRPMEVRGSTRYRELDRLRAKFQPDFALRSQELCPRCKQGVMMKTTAGRCCSRRYSDGCCNWQA